MLVVQLEKRLDIHDTFTLSLDYRKFWEPRLLWKNQIPLLKFRSSVKKKAYAVMD